MIKYKNNAISRTFLVLHVLFMFGVFLFLLSHNVKHQLKPNVNFSINDVGHWQVLDDTHPTLKQGDRVVKLSVANQVYALDKNWLWPTVFNLSDHKHYKSVLERESRLHSATQTLLAQAQYAEKTPPKTFDASPLRLIDATGKTHTLVFRQLTWQDVTRYVWFQYAVGWFIFAIGLASASINPFTVDKLIILLSASCLAVAVFAAVATLDRAWAVDPRIIHARFALGNLCLKGYFFSLVVMLWRLPKSMPYSTATGLVCVGGFGLYLLVTWLLYFFTDNPSHVLNIAMPLFLVTVFCFYLVYRQWCLSKHPDHFKLSHIIALRWMIVIIIVCGIVAFVFNVLWQLGLAESRYGSIINSFNGGIYLIGFAGLIYSGSLYKVETWWWQIWGGFTGLSITLLAAMLLGETVLGYSALSVVLSFILGVIGYIAVTGYFRYKYARYQARLLEAVVPSLVHISSAQSRASDVDGTWQSILQKVFSPKAIESLTPMQAAKLQSAESSSIEQQLTRLRPAGVGAVCHEGDTLLVRGLANNMLALHFSAQGLKLFTKLDLKRAKLLWEVVWQAYQASVAYRQGEAAERKRIACDLHDDIGGKLLHLSSQQGEYGDYARRTLEDLRTLTHGLSVDNKTFAMLIADLRYQLRDQCDAQEVALHFNATLPDDDESVTSKAAVNFYCIVNELARNAMQHSKVENLWITIAASLLEVNILVVNDGAETNPRQWRSGLGVVSIKRRVAQLDGEVDWQAREGGGALCRIDLPFESFTSDAPSPSMNELLALNRNEF